MKKSTKVWISIATLIMLIVLYMTIGPYIYKGIQVAKLEKYVRETDRANGWGESYNHWNVDYYLRERDEVLTLIEVLKKMEPMLPPLFFNGYYVWNFHVGDITVNVYNYFGIIELGNDSFFGIIAETTVWNCQPIAKHSKIGTTEGSRMQAIIALAEGNNTMEYWLLTGRLESPRTTATIICDTAAPTIELINAFEDGDWIYMNFRANEQLASLMINGEEMLIGYGSAEDDSFTFSYCLNKNDENQTISIVATDYAGNTTTITINTNLMQVDIR